MIFKGGDTWHFGNSGAAPYTGGAWSWTQAGTGTNPVYVGVDTTWFTGGSFSRPILTEDNTPVASSGSPPSHATVASCAFGVGASGNMITFGGLNNWIFDDFEITGYCWNNAPSFGNNNMFKMFGANSTNNDYFLRNYIHGWSHTSAGPQADVTQVGSNASLGGWHFWFNVSDGIDSDWYTTGLWGAGHDGWDLAYNYVGHQGVANVSDNCHLIHDNLFEYIQNVTDGSTHSDAIFCFSEFQGGTGNPNSFYNNIFRHIGTLNSQSISYLLQNDTPASQTDYVFNNVAYDAQPGGSGIFDQHDNACTACTGSIVYLNNTVSADTSAGQANPIIGRPGSNPTTAINNHWITAAGTQAQVWQSILNLTESTTTYMTNATALADGYVVANDFAPTSSSSPTVTAAGTNETSGICALLIDAHAIAACKLGTTTGCAYNATSHTVSCPNITANAKPSTGNWQTGAFQFSSISQVATPTLTPSSGSFNASQTVTIASTTAGATLGCTTDGSTPTANNGGTITHGTVYTGPFSVPVNQTVKCIGSESGFSDSGIGSATYQFQGSAPNFSPVNGTSSSTPITATLSQAQGLGMCYTTNGVVPSSDTLGNCGAGSTLYTGPILVSSTEIIRAIGFQSGWTDSPVGFASYTITGAARADAVALPGVILLPGVVIK